MRSIVFILSLFALLPLLPLAAATPPVCDPDTGICVPPVDPGSVTGPVLDIAHVFTSWATYVAQHPPHCWRTSSGQIDCTSIPAPGDP